MPRVTRDTSKITVAIHPWAIGTGTEAEGGGLLRGGLKLMSGFDAIINDPEVPFEILIRVAAIDGWLGAESVTVTRRHEPLPGPAVTSADLRTIALSVYLRLIREELENHVGAGLLLKETGRGKGYVAYDLPVMAEDWANFAQARQATRLTPQLAAETYLRALADPDPEKNRKPVQAAAEALGVSRGHVSRLITEARKKGIPGLGPGRPVHRKDSR